MTRIKLNFPEKVIFSTSIPVRISDINYGGHVGNDSVLNIAHEARIRFLNSLGYSETDIEGMSIIMTDAVINYKNQGYYGDILKIDVSANDIKNNGFDLYYKMTNEKTGIEIARVKTGIAFFDYTQRKTVRIPEAFKNRVEEIS